MKIEKGKLYYNHQLESVVVAVEDGEDKSGILSNKIAVHCPTKEDWEYVVSKGYELFGYYINTCYTLYNREHSRRDFYESHGYHIITIDKFKEFYPEKGSESTLAVYNINSTDVSKEDILEKLKDKVLFSDKIEYARKSLAGVDLSVISDKESVEVFNPQPHYDNTKGSLYKVATERGWSVYTFDVVKRLERGGKKDPLKQEIQKSIDVLTIWLSELGND